MGDPMQYKLTIPGRLPGQWPAGCGAHSYTAIWDRRRKHANGGT